MSVLDGQAVSTKVVAWSFLAGVAVTLLCGLAFWYGVNNVSP